MIKHKAQRVGVFIDVQNMYYSARKLYGHKVNFGEILRTAESDRQLIRAIAYVVRATGEEGGFFEALHARGMETKTRDVQIFEDGARKADWDVGMVVDMIRIGEILDAVVLVSGDGDFVELVEYLKHHGKQVEVIAFKETASAKLVAAADDFLNLSDDKKRFLIAATAKEPTAPRRPQGTPKNAAPKPAVQPPKPVVSKPPAPRPPAVPSVGRQGQPRQGAKPPAPRPPAASSRQNAKPQPPKPVNGRPVPRQNGGPQQRQVRIWGGDSHSS